MHVVLVGAEFEENLAVRYLRGALEQAGHQVTQCGLQRGRRHRPSRPADRRLGRAGGGLLHGVHLPRARVRATRRRARESSAIGGHIVAGGHFAAMHAEQLLARRAARSTRSRAARVSRSCASSCEALPEPGSVAGLVWRRGGEIVHNARAVKPPDLDVLPIPPRKEPLRRLPRDPDHQHPVVARLHAELLVLLDRGLASHVRRRAPEAALAGTRRRRDGAALPAGRAHLQLPRRQLRARRQGRDAPSAATSSAQRWPSAG